MAVQGYYDFINHAWDEGEDSDFVTFPDFGNEEIVPAHNMRSAQPARPEALHEAAAPFRGARARAHT